MTKDSRWIAAAVVFAAVLLAGAILFVNQRNEVARQEARCDEIRNSSELSDLTEYLDNC